MATRSRSYARIEVDGDEEEEQGPMVTYSGEWRWGATHRSGDKIGHVALSAQAAEGEIKERRGGGVRSTR